VGGVGAGAGAGAGASETTALAERPQLPGHRFWWNPPRSQGVGDGDGEGLGVFEWRSGQPEEELKKSGSWVLIWSVTFSLFFVEVVGEFILEIVAGVSGSCRSGSRERIRS
jgi:hypothetical protein